MYKNSKRDTTTKPKLIGTKNKMNIKTPKKTPTQEHNEEHILTFTYTN